MLDGFGAIVSGSDQLESTLRAAAPLVDRLLEGYSCIMGYGQTGSGKAHTIFSPPGALTEASLKLWYGRARRGRRGASRVGPLSSHLALATGRGTLHASAVVYQERAYN